MKQNSTSQLVLIHAYGETNQAQREALEKELSENSTIYEEYMNAIRIKRMLNSKMLSPSATSIRIIMEHSHKTEHLQESN